MAGGRALKFGTDTDPEGGFHPNLVLGVPVPRVPGVGRQSRGFGSRVPSLGRANSETGRARGLKFGTRADMGPG